MLDHFTYVKKGISGESNDMQTFRTYYGTSDAEITPDASLYAEDGFTTPENQTVKINADGSTAVKYVFTRKKYTVSISSDGNKVKSVTGNGSFYFGQTVNASYIVNSGYNATGFKIIEGSIVPTTNTETQMSFTMPAGDVELNAKTEGIKYTVTLELNGGTNAGNAITEYTHGDTVQLPTAKDMLLAGFVFDGWYPHAYFTEESVTEISASEIGNKVYYAKWTSGSYNISLDTDGGTINSGNVETYRYNYETTLPTDVTKDGYSFLGWWDGYKTVEKIGKEEYGDKSYTALWKSNKSAFSGYVKQNGQFLVDADSAVEMTTEIDTDNTGYYYTQLSDNEKMAYATLYENYKFIPEDRKFKNTDNLVFVSDVEFSVGELSNAQMAFIYDHPEVFWIEWLGVSGNKASETNDGRNYYLYSATRAYDINLCNADASAYYGYFTKAVEAIGITETDTDYDKIKKIHDYTLANYSYDKYGYTLNELSSNDTRSVGRMLTMKIGCCEGYAELTKVLCEYYNIPCVLVSSMDHMWNEVQIGGTWYGYDATWDDSSSNYDYFLKGSAQFSDEHHNAVNCMFANTDGTPFTDYACLPAPAIGKDYTAVSNNTIENGNGTNSNTNNNTNNNATPVTTRNVSKVKYKVISAKAKTAKVIGVTSKNITKATIAKTVKINNKTYKVTMVSPNAFKGCKKLKTVVIKSKTLKIGKNAFKGIYKKAKFKVPAKYLKSYKKMLAKKKYGYVSTMKVTK